MGCVVLRFSGYLSRFVFRLPESEHVLFDGWHFVEESSLGSYRWSAKKVARIWLNMINIDLPTPDTSLALELSSLA